MDGNRSVIGSSIVIDGEISGEGSLVVLGMVKGKVQMSEAVVVGPRARVEADIDSGEVEVAGTVVGAIAARSRIQIAAEATVDGKLRAPRLQIAEGAHFRGTVEMAG